MNLKAWPLTSAMWLDKKVFLYSLHIVDISPCFFARITRYYLSVSGPSPLRMRIISDYGFGADSERTRTGNGQKISGDTCKKR